MPLVAQVRRVAWFDRAKRLLGISAFSTPPPEGSRSLYDAVVERVRRAMGGQIAPRTISESRWYQADVETAERLADQGNLAMCARLMRWAHSDGVLVGAMSVRTSFVRLARWYRGRGDIVQALQVGHERSLFDEMCPPNELELMARDTIEIGVSVAELVPIVGRQHPMLVRLDPEFLRYRHEQDRWYYVTVAGEIPITPGDGRWVLHLSGRRNPWQNGIWRALAKPAIRKEVANAGKENWEGKLANPARVAVAPQASTEDQHDEWAEQVLDWTYNTVLTAKPGYDVKLIESNGRGAESFRLTIKESENEIVVAINGQAPSTTGSKGFDNAEVFQRTATHLTQKSANDLSYTISTQVLPAWIADRFGEDALDEAVVMGWDVTPPKDLEARARALQGAANAAKSLLDILARPEMKELLPDARLKLEAIFTEFAVPLEHVMPANEKAERGRPSLRLVGAA